MLKKIIVMMVAILMAIPLSMAFLIPEMPVHAASLTDGEQFRITNFRDNNIVNGYTSALTDNDTTTYANTNMVRLGYAFSAPTEIVQVKANFKSLYAEGGALLVFFIKSDGSEEYKSFGSANTAGGERTINVNIKNVKYVYFQGQVGSYPHYIYEVSFEDGTATPSPTPTTTPTPEPTTTPTTTPTSTPTATPEPTPTVTPDPTLTPEPTPIATPTPTVTPEPTPTNTPTPTVTPTPTATSTATPTPIPTTTPTPTPTVTPNPTPGTGDRAILSITLENGTEREYDLSMSEIESFLNWYDQRDAGRGPGSYAIDKHDNNKGPFKNRKDYVIFDKILTFEVNEYEVTE